MITPSSRGLLGLGTLLTNLLLPIHLSFEKTSFCGEQGTSLAETYFPLWQPRKLCTLGSITTSGMKDIATRAAQKKIWYDALWLNVENDPNRCDPWEIEHPVEAYTKGKGIADEFGVPFMVAPGGRYADTWDDYETATISALTGNTGWWLIQAQRAQIYPPGPQYRAYLEDRMDRILVGNIRQRFIMQASTWAGYPLTAEQLYAYVLELQALALRWPIRHVTLYCHTPEAVGVIRGVMAMYYKLE